MWILWRLLRKLLSMRVYFWRIFYWYLSFGDILNYSPYNFAPRFGCVWPSEFWQCSTTASILTAIDRGSILSEVQFYLMLKVIWWIILLCCQFLNLWVRRLLLMLYREILPIVTVLDGSMFVFSYVYKFTTSSTRYCFLAFDWWLF